MHASCSACLLPSPLPRSILPCCCAALPSPALRFPPRPCTPLAAPAVPANRRGVACTCRIRVCCDPVNQRFCGGIQASQGCAQFGSSHSGRRRHTSLLAHACTLHGSSTCGAAGMMSCSGPVHARRQPPACGGAGGRRKGPAAWRGRLSPSLCPHCPSVTHERPRIGSGRHAQPPAAGAGTPRARMRGETHGYQMTTRSIFNATDF